MNKKYLSRGSKTISGIPTTLQIAVPVLLEKILPSGKKIVRIESLTRHVRLTGVKYQDKRGVVWAEWKDGSVKVTPPIPQYDPESEAEKAVA